jgi:hypothetical protein
VRRKQLLERFHDCCLAHQGGFGGLCRLGDCSKKFGGPMKTWLVAAGSSRTGQSTAGAARGRVGRRAHASPAAGTAVAGFRRAGEGPRTVTADRGYGEACVDAALSDLGVRTVVTP